MVASPALANALVQSVMKGVQANNIQAMRMAGEMIGMLRTNGMQVIAHQQVNNTNTTNSLTIAEGEEKVSFDKICRQRDEERRRRLGLEASGSIEVTSESA